MIALSGARVDPATIPRLQERLPSTPLRAGGMTSEREARVAGRKGGSHSLNFRNEFGWPTLSGLERVGPLFLALSCEGSLLLHSSLSELCIRIQYHYISY